MRRLLFLLLISLNVLVEAANKTGTTGAQFLKIGSGARPTAMGESFVAVPDDVNSVYYNPAGIGFISRPEFTAMRTQWFQGIDYDYGAFVYPTDNGALGISAATLRVENIEKRGTDETLQGTFKSMDAAYAFSAARNFGPLTSVGLTGRFLNQKLDDVSATAWSADVGFMRKLGNHALTVGGAIRHIGQKIKFRYEEDSQPLVYDLGLSRAAWREKILMAMNVKKPNDGDVGFGLGMELRAPLRDNMSLLGRVGYNSSLTDPEDSNGLSVGGGMQFKRLHLDVAWVPLGVLGNTFRYSLKMRF